MPKTVVGIPTRINEIKVSQQSIFSASGLVDTKTHYTGTLPNHNILPVAYLPNLLLETSTPPTLSTKCGERQK